MNIKDIISDIENTDLTNNITLKEIQQFESFLRECIRHIMPKYLDNADEKNHLAVNIYCEDFGPMIRGYEITDIWQTKDDGNIHFEIDFYGSLDRIDFDDMPIDVLIKVLEEL